MAFHLSTLRVLTRRPPPKHSAEEVDRKDLKRQSSAEHLGATGVRQTGSEPIASQGSAAQAASQVTVGGCPDSWAPPVRRQTFRSHLLANGCPRLLQLRSAAFVFHGNAGGNGTASPSVRRSTRTPPTSLALVGWRGRDFQERGCEQHLTHNGGAPKTFKATVFS